MDNYQFRPITEIAVLSICYFSSIHCLYIHTQILYVSHTLIHLQNLHGMGTTQRDIDDLPKNPANYTALTPLGFVERAALVHPTRKSLIHGSVSYTWRQTYRRCRQLASALAKRSVTFGTTVSDFIINDCEQIFFFQFRKNLVIRFVERKYKNLNCYCLSFIVCLSSVINQSL